jgi:hypothetical protein
VRGFALLPSRTGLTIDPGAPPLGDPSSTAYKEAALSVIRSSLRREGSAIAFWGGTGSAPLRWNAIPNAVADSAEGRASASAHLDDDVKRYFALNGALHDTAVAARGAKRAFPSVRPISMIRSLAFAGQSSNSHAPSYSPDGLPLIPGLVELVTRASSAPGRHPALAGHVGDIAIRTADGWVLGTRWTPRTRGETVTPPYPGWVSDGGAFGEAAAEVLAAQTGSALLPRSLREPGALTYVQAARAEGRYGLLSGTQVPADLRAGRTVGAGVGAAAWALAGRYFAGTAK